jgi:hypothetical protein
MTRIKLTIDGVEIDGRGRPDDHGGRGCRGDLHPAALRPRGAAPSGRLPRLHGQGATGAASRPARNPRPRAQIENETPACHEAAPRPRGDAVSRGQPPVPDLRGQRELRVAGHGLPAGHDGTHALSLSGALPSRSMPPIPTSRSTPTAASPAGAASGPPRCRWQGHLRLRGPGHQPAGRRERRRPRPYRRDIDDVASRPRSARWAASSANARASRCRSANGNSTRA